MTDDAETLRATVARLEVENAQLRETADSKAKLATRTLAAYQRRVERLAEALGRLEDRDRRISEDLEEARRFQALLLSRSAQLPGVEMATIYRPAEIVGGDLYDVSSLPDGSLRVFMADATGHGVQAALRTMILKSEYDRLRSVIGSPAALLEALSERLVADYPGLELRSTAACFDVARTASGSVLRYASCAHPPLLVLTPDGRTEELYHPGPFLAASAGIQLTNTEHPVPAGTRVAIYSDGLVEEWCEKGSTFGLGPLVEALRSSGPLPVSLAALESRLLTFVGAPGLSDDATVVALRVA